MAMVKEEMAGGPVAFLETSGGVRVNGANLNAAEGLQKLPQAGMGSCPPATVANELWSYGRGTSPNSKGRQSGT